MDPATIIGIVLALASVVGGMIMEGGNPASLFLIPAMVIVWGGTFGVGLASGLLKDFTGALGAAMKALTGKVHGADDTIRSLVSFAERARRDGLLALEDAAKKVDDPFLRKGLELAVDGTDPEELREILETEIAAKRAADKAAAKPFADMGGFAPTLGIIGTVMGLVHVLENLSNPDELGHLIAGAFVATLWGVLSANLFWLPMANKLKRISEIECHHMELVLEGIMSIQAGSNPRVIEQKLVSFLPASERAGLQAKAA
ncbi:MAG TPA: flagellar motor protein [Acidimicrobiales bacterium]|nr:flagellar motor protein [Acidimicrobiales bacterium]